MPQKGTFHTTMMDKVRIALYQYKRDNPQLSQKDLIKWSSSASSSVLSKVFPLISLLFWCHMYDVLVYKMLWDRKKILNISLWRIIRLSMRPAMGMCPHISLKRILVYTILV